MKKKEEKYLSEAYFNPKKSGAFGGIDKLFQHVKEEGKFNISRKDIKKWLQSQEVHTTNKQIKRFIRRRHVISPYIDYMWDIDTASMLEYKKENKGFGHFILAIDIMSRFVWCEAIKSPTGSAAEGVLKSFFSKDRIPERIRSDKGSEFSNDKMQKFFLSHNIKHFVTQNEVKANYAERAIQTIKGKLMKYMRANQTHHWIDQLQNFTNSYNNSIHSSINQAPSSVTKKDEFKLWQHLYVKKKPYLPKKLSYKFEIGDFVRITRLRHPFERYYSEHWTNELFIIKGRTMKQYIPVYVLVDYDKDPIEGTFYEAELQKVYADENTMYNIEEERESRIEKGVRETLVKWKNWPEKFNSWIPTKNLKLYS